MLKKTASVVFWGNVLEKMVYFFDNILILTKFAPLEIPGMGTLVLNFLNYLIINNK